MEDKKQRENDHQIFILAFNCKQKTTLENDQFDYLTQSQNTENVQYLRNSQKIYTAQKDYLVNSNEQDIIIDIIQESPHLNINELSELDYKFSQSSRNKQQNFSKYSSPTHASQNDRLRKKTFKKQFDQPQINFQSRRYIDSNNQYLNLIQNFKAIKNIKSSNKVQQNLTRIRKQEKDSNGFKLLKIEKQIRKEMNIFNFIYEINLIKKAIMMVLTQDQLAALQIVGCSSSFFEQDLSRDKNNSNESVNITNLSHYEVQIAILQSQNLQSQYVKDFLIRCSDQSKHFQVQDNNHLDNQLQI
ncbi:hypothetical protein ABPG72_002652 [Tetrahymena utriculariae]